MSSTPPPRSRQDALLDMWRAAALRTRQPGGDIETAVDAMVATDETAAARISSAGSGGLTQNR